MAKHTTSSSPAKDKHADQPNPPPPVYERIKAALGLPTEPIRQEIEVHIIPRVYVIHPFVGKVEVLPVPKAIEDGGDSDKAATKGKNQSS